MYLYFVSLCCSGFDEQLKPRAVQRKCVSRCPAGYYANSEGDECWPCTFGCDRCVQDQGKGDDDSSSVLARPPSCTACHPHKNLILHRGRCWQDCPPSHATIWLRNGTGECQSLTCSDDCAACDTALFPPLCRLCKPGLYLFVETGECMKTCPAHLYQSEGNATAGGLCVPREGCPSTTYPSHRSKRSCASCPESCLICSAGAPQICTTCIDGYQRNSDGSCQWIPRLCELRSEYPSNGGCNKCHASCRGCSGPSKDDCSSCHSNGFLSNGSCVGHCPIGFYPTIAQLCQPCDDGCASCNGGGKRSCALCKDGFFLLDGLCQRNCTAYLENVYGPPTRLVNSTSDPFSRLLTLEVIGQYVFCTDMAPEKLAIWACQSSGYWTMEGYNVSRSMSSSAIHLSNYCPFGEEGRCIITTNQHNSTLTSCSSLRIQCGSERIGGFCLSPACLTKYGNSDSVCSCLQGCRSCDENDRGNCSSCYDDRFLLQNDDGFGSCVHHCPQGFYPDGESRDCITCPDPVSGSAIPSSVCTSVVSLFCPEACPQPLLRSQANQPASSCASLRCHQYSKCLQTKGQAPSCGACPRDHVGDGMTCQSKNCYDCSVSFSCTLEYLCGLLRLWSTAST